MSNDPSGNHALPLAPQQFPAGNVSMREIVIGVVLAMAGAGAGGGATFLGGNVLSKQLEDLAGEVKVLTRAVDNLGADGRSSDREHDGFRLMLTDHETRLRKIEEKRRP